MRKALALGLVVLSLYSLQARADQQVTVVSRPDTTATNRFYVGNRSPLEPSPLVKLPTGSIRPKGWLRGQIELTSKGMMGRLEEISEYLNFEDSGWTNPASNKGGEEVPYWLRGYGDLGYVLGDQHIIKNARRWIDAILASQRPNGWFGPDRLLTGSEGKPELYPHMPLLNALQSYYEFSGDERALKFMANYFRWELNVAPREAFGLGWASGRFGDNLESVYWLYNRTGEPWLLELAKKIHDNSAKWYSGVVIWHNVSMVEGFREPAEYWMQAKDRSFLDATYNNYRTFMDKYGQFPGGGFAGDEGCREGYDDPRQGFETCGIVEFMHSFELLTRISGDPVWADRCEEIALNTFPAALTPDHMALHYLTAANMVQLDRENKHPGIDNKGLMFAYSPLVYRCCQHNHGMGWPRYAEELWLATPDNGLCASLYAASEVTAKVGDGTQVTISEETDYPFSDTIQLKLSASKAVEFPLYLRVPRWSGNPQIAVNGERVDVTAKPLSYVVIRREWKDGDTVSVRLPMSLSMRTWKKNKNSVSVDYGPLTFALKIAERWQRYGGTNAWPEFEVFSASPWNYGLVLDEKNPVDSFTMSRRAGPLSDQPFTLDTAPMELKAKARRIPNWTLDANGLLNILQPSPIRSDEPVETVTLIPMGAARLRISAFPVIGNGPDARPWTAPAK